MISLENANVYFCCISWCWLILTYPYLQTSTMISTTAILISKALAEAHWPFFNDGWLITKTQMVLASHPNGQTPVINNPCTMYMNNSLEGTMSSISLEEELAAIFAMLYEEFLYVFYTYNCFLLQIIFLSCVSRVPVIDIYCLHLDHVLLYFNKMDQTAASMMSQKGH